VRNPRSSAFGIALRHEGIVHWWGSPSGGTALSGTEQEIRNKFLHYVEVDNQQLGTVCQLDRDPAWSREHLVSTSIRDVTCLECLAYEELT
jgi:hypothetical protein